MAVATELCVREGTVDRLTTVNFPAGNDSAFRILVGVCWQCVLISQNNNTLPISDKNMRMGDGNVCCSSSSPATLGGDLQQVVMSSIPTMALSSASPEHYSKLEHVNTRN